MTKFQVVFTEESTTTHTYYVDAKDKDEAYLLAEDKYFNFVEADSKEVSYSQTLGHDVVQLTKECEDA